MTTPDQPQHSRGVRGAINDLLGRDDRAGEDRPLDHERSDARTDAGYDPRNDDAGYRDAGYQDPGHQDLGNQDAGYADNGTHPDRTGAVAEPVGAGQSGMDQDGYGAHTDAQVHRSGVQTQTVDPDGGPGAPVQAQHQGQTGFGDTQYDDRLDTDVDHTGSSSEATTTPVAAQPAGHSGVAATAQGEDQDGRERLVSAEHAASYSTRWDTVKGEFVDEPRKAVADADALVGELLDELQNLFTEQRHGIERGLDADETSTEDMRLALRRYRSFFDRLLSI